MGADASSTKHHELGGAIRKALHPIQHHKAKKRRTSASESGLHNATIADASEDERATHGQAHLLEKGLDPAKVVGLFRLNPRQLG